jgi:hypothetical protein
MTSANLGASPQQVNSAFVFRGNYSPDGPADDGRQPIPAEAAARNFDGKPAAVAHATILHAASAFEQHLSSIPVDDYRHERLAREVQGFKSTAAYQAVAPAVQKVIDAADDAAHDAVDAKAALSDSDTSTDPADQILFARIWDRKRAELDSTQGGGPLFDAARTLVANANPTELSVLLAELPSYLKSRGQVSTAWIDPASKAVAPEYAAADASKTLAAKTRDIVIDNAQKLAKAVDISDPNAYRKPSFTDPAVAGSGNTITRRIGL